MIRGNNSSTKFEEDARKIFEEMIWIQIFNLIQLSFLDKSLIDYILILDIKFITYFDLFS
jgi:hypothetical protein